MDGILTSKYAVSKPISEGAAVALAVLAGWWAPTNDSGSERMIWNYNHKVTSSLSSPSRLVDELMRQASRKMPYFVN